MHVPMACSETPGGGGGGGGQEWSPLWGSESTPPASASRKH